LNNIPLLLTLLFVLYLAPAAAQTVPEVPTEQQVRNQLSDRNIDEAELRRRLLERGIDIDRSSPEELLRLQPQIEEVIAELEAEQRAAAIPTPEVEQPAPAPPPVPDNLITEEEAADAAADLPKSGIYGHQIFRNKSLEVFSATTNATPPESYPLKPGDEIAVSIFGASQTDFILRLDEQGFVVLPNQIRMPLGGIPLGEARTLLGNRLRQFYTFRDGQLSVRIQVARTITVNIFGEVETNGSYSMSSLNTGFNALVAAGGPTDAGSVRNIQLINGEETTLLDVYEFLQNPTQRTKLFVSNNATIFVPPAQKIVNVTGGVVRPLRYELKAGETLSDLITFAGGTKPRAETSDLRVTRYVNGVLELINVDLAKEPGFELQNGDLVNIPVVENPIEDFVTVEGAVLLPGRYAFEPGLSLVDLITKGRPRPGARQDVAFLFRTNDDGTSRLIKVALGADAGAADVELQRGDLLRVLSSERFVDRSTFSVEGAIRSEPKQYPFPTEGDITLEEALLLAGGLQANAAPEVMIIRTPVDNSEGRTYQRVKLANAASTVVQPFDRIIVYTNERFTDTREVSIAGAVRNPGSFTYDASLQLSDLLYLAGGTRLDADRDRVEVFRLEILEGAETKTLLTTLDLENDGGFQLRPFDEVIVRSAAEFEAIRNVYVEGEVRYPGQYALLDDNEKLTDLVRRAGGLTEEAFPAAATLSRTINGRENYVVLDLDRAVLNPIDVSNMVLLANDRLSIPKRRDLVTIHTPGTLVSRFGTDSTTVGGVLRVAYQGDKPADWYIKRYAGGFEDDVARKRWTTVEYANGQVKETANFLWIKNYPEVLPGSEIRVALKPPKKQKQRREERFNWIGLASVIVGGVSTIVSFVLIANR